MIDSIHKKQSSLPYKILCGFIALTFSTSVILPPTPVFAQSVLNLPVPGTMVAPSAEFLPVRLIGVTVHPENPLEFDFIVNSGDTNLSPEAYKEESRKLIKYFLASLTVPEDELWVNLSPYEKDRMVPEGLGQTEMGRDMLAQDYLLKQLTASLMYPEKELGKKFWDKIYKEAREKYGTTEIPVNTFNKVWVVPQDAVVYEKDTSAYVVKSRLKVMLESDYQAQKFDTRSSILDARDPSSNEHPASSIETEIIREVILPAIEQEINEGENFANLRQMYNSLILAAWYKLKLKDGLLAKVYVDQNKTKGIDTEDKQVNQKIYDQYIASFKKGVYNYIKEDHDPVTQDMIPRKYFSGGVRFGFGKGIIAMVAAALLVTAPVNATEFNRMINRSENSRVTMVLGENPLKSVQETVVALEPSLAIASSPVKKGKDKSAAEEVKQGTNILVPENKWGFKPMTPKEKIAAIIRNRLAPNGQLIPVGDPARRDEAMEDIGRNLYKYSIGGLVRQGEFFTVIGVMIPKFEDADLSKRFARLIAPSLGRDPSVVKSNLSAYIKSMDALIKTLKKLLPGIKDEVLREELNSKIAASEKKLEGTRGLFIRAEIERFRQQRNDAKKNEPASSPVADEGRSASSALLIAKLEALKERNLAYGLHPGSVSRQSMPIYVGLTEILSELPAGADVANTLVHLKEGDLEALRIFGVLENKEIDIIAAKNVDALNSLTSAEKGAFVGRIRKLTESYEQSGMSAIRKKKMLNRLVPLNVVDSLSRYFDVGWGTLTVIIVTRPSYPVWLFEAAKKVEEIKGRVHGKSNAWEILMEHGLEKADEWVRSAEDKVREIKGKVGGESNAWRIVIDHDVEKTDAWIAQMEPRVQELVKNSGISERGAWTKVIFSGTNVKSSSSSRVSGGATSSSPVEGSLENLASVVNDAITRLDALKAVDDQITVRDALSVLDTLQFDMARGVIDFGTLSRAVNELAAARDNKKIQPLLENVLSTVNQTRTHKSIKDLWDRMSQVIKTNIEALQLSFPADKDFRDNVLTVLTDISSRWNEKAPRTFGELNQIYNQLLSFSELYVANENRHPDHDLIIFTFKAMLIGFRSIDFANSMIAMPVVFTEDVRLLLKIGSGRLKREDGFVIDMDRVRAVRFTKDGKVSEVTVAGAWDLLDKLSTNGVNVGETITVLFNNDAIIKAASSADGTSSSPVLSGDIEVARRIFEWRRGMVDRALDQLPAKVLERLKNLDLENYNNFMGHMAAFKENTNPTIPGNDEIFKLALGLGNLHVPNTIYLSIYVDRIMSLKQPDIQKAFRPLAHSVNELLKAEHALFNTIIDQYLRFTTSSRGKAAPKPDKDLMVLRISIEGQVYQFEYAYKRSKRSGRTALAQIIIKDPSGKKLLDEPFGEKYVSQAIFKLVARLINVLEKTKKKEDIGAALKMKLEQVKETYEPLKADEEESWLKSRFLQAFSAESKIDQSALLSGERPATSLPVKVTRQMLDILTDTSRYVSVPDISAAAVTSTEDRPVLIWIGEPDSEESKQAYSIIMRIMAEKGEARVISRNWAGLEYLYMTLPYEAYGVDARSQLIQVVDEMSALAGMLQGGASSSPVGQMVKDFINTVKPLNARFARELDELALDFSPQRLNALQNTAREIRSAVGDILQSSRREDTAIVNVLGDVMRNKTSFTIMADLEIDEDQLPGIRVEFSNYQKELQNLELILERGELKDIEKYLDYGRFVNLDQLPEGKSEAASSPVTMEGEEYGAKELDPQLERTAAALFTAEFGRVETDNISVIEQEYMGYLKDERYLKKAVMALLGLNDKISARPFSNARTAARKLIGWKLAAENRLSSHSSGWIAHYLERGEGSFKDVRDRVKNQEIVTAKWKNKASQEVERAIEDILAQAQLRLRYSGVVEEPALSVLSNGAGASASSPVEQFPSYDFIKERFRELHPNWYIFEQVLDSRKGTSGRVGEGYHSYEHGIENAYLVYLVGKAREYSPKRLLELVVAAALHDYHPRQSGELPKVSETLRYLRQDTELISALEALGVDLNVISFLIERTDHPWKEEQARQFEENLNAIVDRKEKESVRSRAELLQMIDKMETFISLDGSSFWARTDGLYRFERKTDVTPKEIAEGSEAFLNELKKDLQFGPILDDLPSWARTNLRKNEQFLNEVKLGQRSPDGTPTSSPVEEMIRDFINTASPRNDAFYYELSALSFQFSPDRLDKLRAIAGQIQSAVHSIQGSGPEDSAVVNIVRDVLMPKMAAFVALVNDQKMERDKVPALRDRFNEYRVEFDKLNLIYKKKEIRNIAAYRDRGKKNFALPAEWQGTSSSPVAEIARKMLDSAKNRPEGSLEFVIWDGEDAEESAQVYGSALRVVNEQDGIVGIAVRDEGQQIVATFSSPEDLNKFVRWLEKMVTIDKMWDPRGASSPVASTVERAQKRFEVTKKIIRDSLNYLPREFFANLKGWNSVQKRKNFVEAREIFLNNLKTIDFYVGNAEYWKQVIPVSAIPDAVRLSRRIQEIMADSGHDENILKEVMKIDAQLDDFLKSAHYFLNALIVADIRSQEEFPEQSQKKNLLVVNFSAQRQRYHILYRYKDENGNVLPHLVVRRAGEKEELFRGYFEERFVSQAVSGLYSAIAVAAPEAEGTDFDEQLRFALERELAEMEGKIEELRREEGEFWLDGEFAAAFPESAIGRGEDSEPEKRSSSSPVEFSTLENAQEKIVKEMRELNNTLIKYKAQGKEGHEVYERFLVVTGQLSEILDGEMTLSRIDYYLRFALIPAMKGLLKALIKMKIEGMEAFAQQRQLEEYLDGFLVRAELFREVMRQQTEAFLPMEQMVNNFINTIRPLNDRFARELDELALDFSQAKLSALKNTEEEIKLVVDNIRSSSQADAVILDIVRDVMANRTTALLGVRVIPGSEQGEAPEVEVPKVKERFTEYLREFQNLQLIMERGELRNIAAYQGFGRFANLDQLPKVVTYSRASGDGTFYPEPLDSARDGSRGGDPVEPQGPTEGGSSRRASSPIVQGKEVAIKGSNFAQFSNLPAVLPAQQVTQEIKFVSIKDTEFSAEETAKELKARWPAHKSFEKLIFDADKKDPANWPYVLVGDYRVAYYDTEQAETHRKVVNIRSPDGEIDFNIDDLLKGLLPKTFLAEMSLYSVAVNPANNNLAFLLNHFYFDERLGIPNDEYFTQYGIVEFDLKKGRVKVVVAQWEGLKNGRSPRDFDIDAKGNYIVLEESHHLRPQIRVFNQEGTLIAEKDVDSDFRDGGIAVKGNTIFLKKFVYPGSGNTGILREIEIKYPDQESSSKPSQPVARIAQSKKKSASSPVGVSLKIDWEKSTIMPNSGQVGAMTYSHVPFDFSDPATFADLQTLLGSVASQLPFELTNETLKTAKLLWLDFVVDPNPIFPAIVLQDSDGRIAMVELQEHEEDIRELLRRDYGRYLTLAMDAGYFKRVGDVSDWTRNIVAIPTRSHYVDGRKQEGQDMRLRVVLEASSPASSGGTFYPEQGPTEGGPSRRASSPVYNLKEIIKSHLRFDPFAEEWNKAEHQNNYSFSGEDIWVNEESAGERFRVIIVELIDNAFDEPVGGNITVKLSESDDGFIEFSVKNNAPINDKVLRAKALQYAKERRLIYDFEDIVLLEKPQDDDDSLVSDNDIKKMSTNELIFIDKLGRDKDEDLKERGGAGRGLRAVKKAIEALGGELAVESNKDSTTFMVTIEKEEFIDQGELLNKSSSPIMSSPGGIDFNSGLLDLQIKRDGNGVPLPLPQQPIDTMHIDGFVPIIINITPIPSLPMLLGLADTAPDTKEAKPELKSREVETVSLLN